MQLLRIDRQIKVNKFPVFHFYLTFIGSSHIPLHLLCCTHTCEAFDRGNLHVLKEIETHINLKEILISSLPDLQSFLFGKSCTEAALTAFTKLLTNTGHQSSLHLEFEQILLDRKRTKKIHLFKERRFCELGYEAGAVLFHWEDIKELLETTRSNNRLVMACKQYFDCDFIKSGFRVLSYFSHRLTFPYFNFCEKSTQSMAREVFPRLYTDLTAKRLDTLDEFRVNYSFEVPEIETETEKVILEQFCLRAAKDFKLQKGREYGFNEEANQRATDLSLLSESDIKGFPITNMVCEREFATADHLLSRSAKTASNFKGLGNIRSHL